MALSEDRVLQIGLFVTLILSIAIHEFGHAWSAKLLGDPLAAGLGRCTLNPIPHLDLVFSVLLPGALIFSGTGMIFGAGKPVPVDTRNLKHPAFYMMLISVAGPAMNVVLAVITTLIFHAMVTFQGMNTLSTEGLFMLYAVRLNFALAILNMLPVPPLDGHRVLALFMPGPIRERFYRMHFLGIALFAVLLAGMFGWIEFNGFHWLADHVLEPFSEFYSPFMPDELQIFPGSW